MVMLNPLMRAMLSDQTCGAACWKAVEDICRCMCGGANHGCQRDATGDQPQRTRQVKGRLYYLVAVHAEWYDARKDAYARMYPHGMHGPRMASDATEQRATGHMLKWPEIQQFLQSHDEAYMVWSTSAA